MFKSYVEGCYLILIDYVVLLKVNEKSFFRIT